MTIDEAIKHCYEDAEKELKDCSKNPCANEHLQLAKWLEELKEFKRGEQLNEA